ncbi:MAG: Lrp/AsnC ligand binding domain-containing protein [Methanosarcinales archaeon]|nr:MAG: Lrp/AsnC ligand binding domain-containing protein [Methanosarcinales archaeon]
MVVGVTMINVVPGEERSVYNELMKMGEIKDVFHVFGEYDFVVVMEVEGLSTLNKLVDQIREINGVTATKTIVGAEL